MKIQIETRPSYGNDLIYVVGPAAAMVQQLTGKKTVNYNDIAALIGLGHEVEEIGRPVQKYSLA